MNLYHCGTQATVNGANFCPDGFGSRHLQGKILMTSSNRRHLARVRNAFLGATALAGVAVLAPPASAVVINDNFTPNDPTVVDDGGVANKNVINGVGQMVIDLQNGFIGLCTVSLINPRTQCEAKITAP